MRIARTLRLLLVLSLASATSMVGSAANLVSNDVSREAQQFAFWLGEWSVKLRTLQADQSWTDTGLATAKIYPILLGKAVLELWDDGAQILGFSIRYFDTAKDAWVL